MLFFAIINAITFIATLLFIPSMPVKERLSYGAQLSVLKNSITWLSIAAVIFTNSAIFGVYVTLLSILKRLLIFLGKQLV
jgi:predicted MFS family arabinose efflux permease